MFGRIEALRQTSSLASNIFDAVGEMMRQWQFVSAGDEKRGFPEEEQLRSYEMTFSFPDDWFPVALIGKCKPYSRPGIRISKQIKNVEQPVDGWKAIVERVVLFDGNVDEQVGPYERFEIDLSSGKFSAQI